jgi:tetratricopeptide (TPR) repeat protein
MTTRLFIIVSSFLVSLSLYSQSESQDDRCLPQNEYVADSLESIADSLVNLEEYYTAKELYIDALVECPSPHALKMLAYVESTIEVIQANEYNKLVFKADKEFSNGQLQKALIYYKAALTLKPKDSYSKSQIEKIEGQ